MVSASSQSLWGANPIALLAMAYLCTSSAASAESRQVPHRGIANGPTYVTGDGANKMSSGTAVNAPPVNPLSKRAQQIKEGLATPKAPQATPVQIGPPLRSELP